ncbi:hypothetical protein TIFTF001_034153 [Ficus carica]|uniref:Uncharacterized protein n=1 Tax=Ficus carica TaxID=3494 RepID=A0AA88JAA0_FICCA|nr:hypothetical protein TIFTF001_034153 [Ficus carica]
MPSTIVSVGCSKLCQTTSLRAFITKIPESRSVRIMLEPALGFSEFSEFPSFMMCRYPQVPSVEFSRLAAQISTTNGPSFDVGLQFPAEIGRDRCGRDWTRPDWIRSAPQCLVVPCTVATHCRPALPSKLGRAISLYSPQLHLLPRFVGSF